MIIYMVFKRAVLYLLAAGPILLLGLIGVNTRMNQPAWRFTEYGPATSANIYAYVPQITQARKLTEPNSNEAELNKTIELWLHGYRAGKLKDIKPASARFDSTSGTYLQILAAKHTLLNRAIKLGESREKSGDIPGALQVYSQVIEIGDIGKYGDFSAYTDASSKQAQVLRRIAVLAPRLDFLQRQQVAESLKVLTSPRKSILDVIENVAMAYRADREQIGEKPIHLMLSSSPHLLASTSNTLDERLAEWQKLSVLDPDLIPLYGKSRIAYIQHRQVTEAAMMTVTALDLSYVN